MDRLDVRIKGHDKEIERMCNYHYQGFIESIRSLLQVRGQVESIKVIYSLSILMQSVRDTESSDTDIWQNAISSHLEIHYKKFQRMGITDRTWRRWSTAVGTVAGPR